MEVCGVIMQYNSALSNLKILDFTTLLPGPYATLMLADMGAQVLKIGSKSKSDLLFDMGAFDDEIGLSANQLWLNRNKKTMSLNLKTKEAVEIVKELVKEYDILFEQFRPGIMEKLGLSYEVLSEINPRLIYCSITGYGQTGPDKDRAGHDINFVAKSGILSTSGREKTGPTPLGTQIGDLAGGALHSLVGMFAALNYRNMTGKGQFVDISMLDCIIPMNTMQGASYLMDGKQPQRESTWLLGKGIYDVFETADGKYISIASLEPKFLEKFAKAIEMPQILELGAELDEEQRVKDELIEKIKSRPRAHWEALFKDLDACIEPVCDFEDVFDKDEHVREREVIVEVEADLPNGQNKKIRQFAMPIKFSRAEVRYEHAGREIGYDTFAILENMGYSMEKIKSLEAMDVFS